MTALVLVVQVADSTDGETLLPHRSPHAITNIIISIIITFAVQIMCVNIIL